MSYDRMVEAHARLAADVAEIMFEAQRVDAQ
jgi:hypothetical protein